MVPSSSRRYEWIALFLLGASLLMSFGVVAVATRNPGRMPAGTVVPLGDQGVFRAASEGRVEADVDATRAVVLAAAHHRELGPLTPIGVTPGTFRDSFGADQPAWAVTYVVVNERAARVLVIVDRRDGRVLATHPPFEP